MSIQIVRNEVPQPFQIPLAEGLSSAIGDREGVWQIDLTSEPQANAWDIEIIGPGNLYWTRRFSGEDRDVDVIAEAVRAGILDQAA